METGNMAVGVNYLEQVQAALDTGVSLDQLQGMIQEVRNQHRREIQHHQLKLKFIDAFMGVIEEEIRKRDFRRLKQAQKESDMADLMRLVMDKSMAMFSRLKARGEDTKQLGKVQLEARVAAYLLNQGDFPSEVAEKINVDEKILQYWMVKDSFIKFRQEIGYE